VLFPAAAACDFGNSCDESFFCSEGVNWTLPRRHAPSSTLMRWLTTSPVSEPSLRISHAIAAFHGCLVTLPHNYNFTRGNVSGDHAVPADGHAMIFEADSAFDAAVHVERLATGDFAFDHQRASDAWLARSAKPRFLTGVTGFQG